MAKTNANRLGSTGSKPSKGRGPVKLKPETPLEGTPLGASRPGPQGSRGGRKDGGRGGKR